MYNRDDYVIDYLILIVIVNRKRKKIFTINNQK